MKKPDQLLLLVMILVIIITTGIRFRLVDLPLERDEGEYAYSGQLLLQGVPPFAEAYNMKMPGIYAAYAAVLTVFGQSHRGIHFALILINVLTTVLLFLLFRRLFDNEIAFAGAAGFSILSLTPASLGITANAEHFVLLFAVTALLVLLRGVDKRKGLLVLASGFIFGIAFLMKQHAIFFIAYGVTLLAMALPEFGNRKKRIGTGLLFLLGAVIPFGLLCVMLWSAGVFDRFWFWTFDYGRSYVSQAPLPVGARLLVGRLVELVIDSPVVWILAVVGLVAPLIQRATSRKQHIALYTFVALSFLSTAPGLFFRAHYFILFLPAVALLSGIGINALAKRIPFAKHAIISFVILIAVVAQLAAESQLYFSLSPSGVSRRIYGTNPFPESLEVAKYIREHSAKNDRIAVLGSEPQVYFYSGRRSATGYVYTYALMERHDSALDMQKEMIRQIEAARPKFIVLVGVRTSWLVRRDSKRLIFEWAEGYLSDGYNKVRTYPDGAQAPAMELWERSN